MITVRTLGATSCQLALVTHPWVRVTYSHQPASCLHDVYRGWATLGPNPATDRLPIVFRFTARNGTSVVSRLIVVTMEASAARHPVPTATTTTTTVTTTPVTTTTQAVVPPSVENLDVCAPGPDCYYGPIYATYQTYGNVAPDGLADCSFASAADWEQIVLGMTPDASVIGDEFAAAGGTSAGLPQSDLWTYWQQDGIDGVFLTGLDSYYTDQTDVENGVRDYAAMIIELNFAQGTYFGDYQMNAGLHDAVVDGFTPEGPLVVTWGQTIQMTWQQWNDEVIGMWGIASNPS